MQKALSAGDPSSSGLSHAAYLIIIVGAVSLERGNRPADLKQIAHGNAERQ
jgi:hypothetical protein